MEQPDLFDPSQSKHHSDPESQQAFLTGDKDRDRQRVLELIKSAGSYGMTLDEVSIALRRPPNALSGRITELKARACITWNGRRRNTRTGTPAKVYVTI